MNDDTDAAIRSVFISIFSMLNIDRSFLSNYKG